MNIFDFNPDRPIYPIAIKEPSGIRSWRGWPDDVRPILEKWNRQKGGLSFANHRLFKCPDCGEFCREHNGCIFGRFTANPEYVCDDCVIIRARSGAQDSSSNIAPMSALHKPQDKASGQTPPDKARSAR